MRKLDAKSERSAIAWFTSQGALNNSSEKYQRPATRLEILVFQAVILEFLAVLRVVVSYWLFAQSSAYEILFGIENAAR